jgi:hypothetical protein
MKAGVSGIKTFSFGQDLVFDAYVQFKVRLSRQQALFYLYFVNSFSFCRSVVSQVPRDSCVTLDMCLQEYIGFVKAMNALRGMKLCYQDRDTNKAWTANIRVTFLFSAILYFLPIPMF